MKEQLISFETARLAKEKGFNYKVDRYFGLPNMILYNFKKYKQKQFKVECEKGLYQPDNFNKYSITVSAPTQGLLQKWLRDEYNINCRVASNALFYHFAMIEILEDGAAQMCGPKEMKVFKTYEEALEEGLQEGLKLIKQ